MAIDARGRANLKKYLPLVQSKINEFMSNGIAINPCSITLALGLQRNRFHQNQWGTPILKMIQAAQAAQRELLSGGEGGCSEELISAVVRTAVRAWQEEEVLTGEDYCTTLRNTASAEAITKAIQTAIERGLIEADERDLFTLYLPTSQVFNLSFEAPYGQEEAA